MTLPDWLIQIGSLAGLGTLIFTIIDRLFSGRPIISIRPAGYNTRDIVCYNPSKHDILIRKIVARPTWVGVAQGQSPQQVAAMGEAFSIYLAPDTFRDFPLVFRKGELMDRECTVFAPFMIWVSWRRAQAAWMPQVPVVKFSSAKSMRRLVNIRTGQPRERGDG
jgi:hypothetical protein